MEDLLGEFVAETREMLQAISGEIVAWEADPADRTRLDAIFRFVHTVKGSCGFLNLPRLERLSHAAEDGLSAVRAGKRAPDADFVSAILAIIDRIGEIVEAIETGDSVPEDGEDRLIAAPGVSSSRLVREVIPAAQRTRRAARTRTRTVRLPVDLLDRMMAGISDLVLARNEMARALRDAETGPELDAAFKRLSGSVSDLREAITRTRMQRIENLFAALPRMVRDTAQQLGKSVELVVDGAEVELDREMIDLIRDPLMHMVRNAIDHGIERPDERRAAGKPPAGVVAVRARQSGNQILIEIVDDGRGLDPERLVERARMLGMIEVGQGGEMSEPEKLALIFEPGFSTSETVTAISGRGVGMDIVRSNIERIGGTVDLERRRDGGLRIVLNVPLTLTIIGALTVDAGGLRLALPRAAVREIIHDTNPALRIDRAVHGTTATIRGQAFPFVDLEKVLGVDPGPRPVAGRCLVILQSPAGDSFALGVARILDHEELVIKPASPPVMATGLYAGTALPDNGVPMLLLDPAGIAATADIKADRSVRSARPAANDDAGELVRKMLLFHDRDGRVRAIGLDVVQRIGGIGTDGAGGASIAVAFDDGRLVLAGNGSSVPETMERIRLNDGTTRLDFAVRDVVDVVDLPTMAPPANAQGAIAGLSTFKGMTVEILDARWLFAEATALAGLRSRPLCRIQGRDRWTRDTLRPMIEAAGYRVEMAEDGAKSSDAGILVIADDDGGSGKGGRESVVRLRSHPAASGAGDESIYRHDRAALLDRLARLAGGMH